MNIAEIIKDALRGRAQRCGKRCYQRTGHFVPEDFLKTEVWPLLKETREHLEARGHLAIATRPASQDLAHTYSLLILDSSCQNADDACFLRFQIFDDVVQVSVRTPARKDLQPRPLDPPGNALLIEDLLADFIFDCLSRQSKPGVEFGRTEAEAPTCGLPVTG